MHSAVFLDRDNTIIANDGDLGDPAQVRLLPGAAWGLRAMREAGYLLVVVTNQGGVARGAYTESAVADVHRACARLLHAECEWHHTEPLVLDWLACPYHPEGTVEAFRMEHPWRKPAPGMLLEAARRHAIDCARSWMVGDQERDIEAGRAAGCRTIRVLRPGEDLAALRAASGADFVEADLLHASHRILRADARDGAPLWTQTTGVNLAAVPGQLDESATRELVAATARAIAEREGVPLARLSITARGVELEVAAAEIVALGLASELRRNTNLWAASRGMGPLWTGE